MSKSKYVDGINEENMDKFLAALRSGDYQQARNQLESREGGFCCLGVACNLAHKAGVVDREDTQWGAIYYNGTSGALPEEVGDWLGLPETHRIHGTDSFDVPFFKSGFEDRGTEAREYTAIGLNDGLEKSFVEIADAFEKEFTKEEN
jgi:hypothetical protein